MSEQKVRIGDFLLCCLIATFFIISNGKLVFKVCLVIAIAAICILLSLHIPVPIPLAFGWRGFTQALSLTIRSTFSSSYEAVARDIGVVLYVGYRRWRAGGWGEVNKWFQSAKDAGFAIVVSIVGVCIYHLLVTIPRVLTPEGFHRTPSVFVEPPPKPATQQGPTIAKCVISPNAGAGGPEYKRMCDLQFAQTVIDEANKIEDKLDDARDESTAVEQLTKTQESFGTKVWRFSQRFDDCCKPFLPGIRMEILARLGPAAQDEDEIRCWKRIFPDPLPPRFPAPLFKIDLGSAREYTFRLRKLGVHLKRTVVPRSKPIDLRFTQQPSNTADAFFPHRDVVTISSDKPIYAGYIVITLTGEPGHIVYGLERRNHAASMNDITDNEELSKTLSHGLRTVAIRIGSEPLSQTNRALVDAEGKSPISVASVQLLDE